MEKITESFDSLCAQTQSDKGATGCGYGTQYDTIIGPRRQSIKSILEIGVSGGGSMKLWPNYLPNAKIYGVDIDPMCAAYSTERITILIGDATNSEFILDKVAPLGPFDLIVDDGSHDLKDQMLSFEKLFPSVSPGGIYIIEDILTESPHEPLIWSAKGHTVMWTTCRYRDILFVWK